MKSQAIIFVLALIFIFGITANAATTWTVTKSTNSNDGVCNADCSLREAVAVAVSGDRIIFNSNLIGQTFTLGGTAISVSGKNLEIDGNLDGVNVAFLSGSDNTFHFNISNNASLSLKNMILAAGRGGQQGSILCRSSNLSLDRVAIRGNRGSSFGAIQFVQEQLINNTQVITNSSITGNVADGPGATLFSAISLNQLSTLYMSNTTISNNRSISGGGEPNFNFGAIFVGGTVILRNCTIIDNQTNGRGGGIYAQGNRTLDIGNTIVAGNTAGIEGQDIFVAPASNTISRGGNLIGNSDTVPGGLFNQTNDQLNVNPLLAPSNSNQGGHPVFTHPLQAGSPARNTGRNAFAVEPFSNLPLTNDARAAGFPRIAGGTVDKGAFEDQSNGSSLVVSKLANSNDNVCDLDCSLREAIFAAGNDAGTDTITFAFNVFGTLDMGGSEIVIQDNDVNIVGYPNLDAETLVVSGDDTNRIFRINNSDVLITGMTFAHGNGVGALNSNFGGAIYAHANSNLTLDKVIVRNNEATTYGALYLLGGTHRIINSTIYSNQATTCIAVGNISGTLNMANVTLSTNFDSNGGTGAGALCNINATANIRNSTIAFNRIGNDPGAGIWSNGTLNIGNTIVSNNIAGSNPDINNVFGTITSVGGNLVQNTNGFANGTFAQQNDAVSLDPQLQVLGDNGGSVPTHELLANSPAVNLGLNPNAIDFFDNSALTHDARGYTRISNYTVDKGAFETLAPTAASVSVSGRVLVGKGGLTNATVYLTDQYGNARSTVTGSFGKYEFENVAAGETYVVTVVSKRYQFNSQVIAITENVAELDFSAEGI